MGGEVTPYRGSKAFRRFRSWVQKHYGPGQCEFCEYVHDGHLDYRMHLKNVHVNENGEFEKWAGLT